MDDKTITMQQAADMYNDMFSPDKAENIHDYSLAYAPYPNITGMASRKRIDDFIQSYILTPDAIAKFEEAGYSVNYMFLSDAGVQNMVFEFSITEKHPLYDPLISDIRTRTEITPYAIHRKKVDGKMLLCICKVYDSQYKNRPADLFEGYYKIIDSLCTMKLKSAYELISVFADVVKRVNDENMFRMALETIYRINRNIFPLRVETIGSKHMTSAAWESSIYNEDVQNRMKERFEAAKEYSARQHA